MEIDKKQSKVSQFFYKYWWLFYLLIFILIGLIFFIGCHPKNNTELESVHQNLTSLEDQIECGLRNKEKKSSELPENAIPCDSGPTYSGGEGFTENQHVLGDFPGNVTVHYNMQVQPDQIEVLYEGQIVASTKDLVSGEGSLTWYYNPKNGGPTYCNIRITAPEDGTVWSYNLGCPE